MNVINETTVERFERAGIEATRTGYTVTVHRRGKTTGDLVTYPYGPNEETADRAYFDACITADSINKHGKYVGRNGDVTISIKGKKIEYTKTSIH